jgi:hypothetical protein
VAVAALLLWLCTAAVGTYMLVKAINRGNAARAKPVPGEPVTASARRSAAQAAQVTRSAQAAQAAQAAPPAPPRARDLFDPPSLQRAKAESLPGLRDLAEFAHPALAFIGFGLWFGYVVSRDRLFAAIGLGILLGAVCAGVSWFTVNSRARRRAAAAVGTGDADGDSAPPAPGPAPLLASPRLLVLHVAGAALTVLFVALITARV